MAKLDEFPLIISPNLGCPRIVSIEELEHGQTIPLIIAGQYSDSITPLKSEFLGTLCLRCSSSNREDKIPKDISLTIEDEPEEITEWNKLSDFKNAEDTRYIFNSEFHYKVMGENTRYWKIRVKVNLKSGENYRILLRQKRRIYLPAIYDLVYTDKSRRWERINYHSVQFVKSFENKCNFIHLTDLHVATRNDEILDEVLKEKNTRGREDIRGNYVNFNENLRKFIKKANECADNGTLDFVVITGDLVDFAFHGWEDEPNYIENNWKTFMNIITGAGLEGTVRGNSGIKIAVFTSTGNHDWRLHPYDPNLSDSNRKSYGLKKGELEHYNFKIFDSAEYPGDERAKLSEELTSDILKKINLNAFTKTNKWKIQTEKLVSGVYGTWTKRTLPFLAMVGGIWEKGKPTKIADSVIYLAIIGISWIVPWGISKGIKYITRKTVDLFVDNPLHAEARALHYYFRYINPYLDYAFRYGEHSFLVMDTGSDVFIGKLLDNEKAKYLKRMSLEDNILGGSPDSRAFDSEQVYYNWSQIVWLEKALAAIPNNPEGKNRAFIFLHAPPINPPDNVDLRMVLESEQDGKCSYIPAPKEHNRVYEFIKYCFAYVRSKVCKSTDRVLKPGEECNLTYGSVNHYLSQFFYLCLGYRESELPEENAERKFKPVDIVFSGHAHKNIEFRIEKDQDHKIRIYHDWYSNTQKSYNCWGKSPVIVQTASCGVPGGKDDKPPYYRKVTIDNSGQITQFVYSNSLENGKQ